jgi:hypothetical protein
MITQKQVDQIINVGRLYVPDEKPFFKVFKKFYPDTSVPNMDEWKDWDWTDEQRQFLRDHGLDI